MRVLAHLSGFLGAILSSVSAQSYAGPGTLGSPFDGNEMLAVRFRGLKGQSNGSGGCCRCDLPLSFATFCLMFTHLARCSDAFRAVLGSIVGLLSGCFR